MPSSERKGDQAGRSSGQKCGNHIQALAKSHARDTPSPALTKSHARETPSPSSTKVQSDTDPVVDLVQDINNPPASGKGPKRSLTLTTRCSSSSRSSQVSTTPSLAGSGKSSHHEEPAAKEDVIRKLSNQEESTAKLPHDEGTGDGVNEQEAMDRRSRGRCRSALPHSAVLVVKILKWRYSDDDVAKTAFERTEQWIKNHAGSDVHDSRPPSPLDDHITNRPRSQSLSKIRTGKRENKMQQQEGEREKGMFGKMQEAKERGSKGAGHGNWKKEKAMSLTRKKSLI